MSNLLVQVDEILRRMAKEEAARDAEPDPWGVVAEIALASVLACILSLICC